MVTSEDSKHPKRLPADVKMYFFIFFLHVFLHVFQKCISYLRTTLRVTFCLLHPYFSPSDRVSAVSILHDACGNKWKQCNTVKRSIYYPATLWTLTTIAFLFREVNLLYFYTILYSFQISTWLPDSPCVNTCLKRWKLHKIRDHINFFPFCSAIKSQ